MKKVLIANRGEIAVRVIRACRQLNLKTVAVYSTADRTALHVQLADEACCIGPAAPKQSYLNMNAIITAAKLTNADAIHPGYGFLSENAVFAQLCAEHNLTFIGPSAHVIALMGEKARARETMRAAGVPVVPGSKTEFNDQQQGLQAAIALGFPVMLKASAGGGGKGMRIISHEDQFKESFTLAQNEALHAFNDNHMYLEKYLPHPRHIEVQVFADKFGNAVALGERDCTLQQHHQKVIEEAPATILKPATRAQMFAVSVKAAQEIGYVGAGTMEFLLDDPDHFYFMEMNTRIQVEHPVTELTSGLDLVTLQLRIAAGEKLPSTINHKIAQGFALECRINARTAGKIQALHLPAGYGIRTDSALYQGYQVPPNYDSMIAKIIAFGPKRQTVIQMMLNALDETVIAGPQTNLDFLMQLLAEPAFLANTTDINWLDHLTAN
ncbi:acetyl-CoA carboxylase biotin carboxylase subunit [Liquorilactobacillus satsumensis]|uniref:acetyl-CoA carboxylase biotin carboxylase subunit n=1 Tax=Liquorilactobacillus satsumensis TaxID=259059 RepID=UPI0021C342AA|nr:acetyl-CoA carboxylase biotin carboxylase subunit [Liquorilactobacillus satsumensis]MCP9312446.1 acetyl-CoA carboxylase biotin carboxylase subunit [Liquorilactobacillus satsumensis]MCP9359735.1 acetyl-CoA carboxylase biotin carboxylase subunit [Liquorilactobacillus satsumensis]